MALSYHERVSQAMQLFLDGTRPFVERELQAAHGERWEEVAQSCLRANRDPGRPQNEPLRWDAYLVLIILAEQWHPVFKTRLGPLERSLVSELREFRNSWAHQRPFDFDDTYRTLDSVRRFLEAITSDRAEEARRQQNDLLQTHVHDTLLEEAKKANALSGRRWRFAIYGLCCVILSIQAMSYWGWKALPLVVGVLAIFTLLMRYARTSLEDNFAVHECKRCGRIVYIEPCPYCVKT